MFKYTKRMCLIAGAVVAFFGGFSTPAWATYGGGACHRCAPPAVVESQCNVVALAPQVQTVYQTVYETVYDSEPMTVMETRYRMAYQTENYTVMRPVAETTYVERPYTVMKPVYQTVNQERRYRVMKPVYQTERRERRYTRDEAGLSDGQPGAALYGLPSRSCRPSGWSGATRSASRCTRRSTRSGGTRS